ncbi:MAG TPA: hypothetical protein VH372_09570 [Actinospica sp.]|jgi:hypothetical protein|nr:hypothetical protein [Actinospica sp.]
MSRRVAVLFGALAAAGAFAFTAAAQPTAPVPHRAVVANDAGPESSSPAAAV